MYMCLGKDASAGGIFPASYEGTVGWRSNYVQVQDNSIKSGF